MSKISKISVIIPTYNEENRIEACLGSLIDQTLSKTSEVIVIDDTSTDNTPDKVKKWIFNHPQTNIHIFTQKHSGPGVCRNLGAKKANGKVLVFVDADMTFEKNFLEKITKPVFENKAIGCDTSEGLLANGSNFWSKCWNIGRFYSAGVVSSKAYKEMDPVKLKDSTIFRAISKKTFLEAGGFDTDGDYADDESISRKLGVKAFVVKNAIYYHFNPDSLTEVIQRTIWIGNSKKINNPPTKWINLVRFSPPISLIKGLIIGFRYNCPEFVIFKIIYDFVIWIQTIKKL